MQMGSFGWPQMNAVSFDWTLLAFDRLVVWTQDRLDSFRCTAHSNPAIVRTALVGLLIFKVSSKRAASHKSSAHRIGTTRNAPHPAAPSGRCRGNQDAAVPSSTLLLLRAPGLPPHERSDQQPCPSTTNLLCPSRNSNLRGHIIIW